MSASVVIAGVGSNASGLPVAGSCVLTVVILPIPSGVNINPPAGTTGSATALGDWRCDPLLGGNLSATTSASLSITGVTGSPKTCSTSTFSCVTPALAWAGSTRTISATASGSVTSAWGGIAGGSWSWILAPGCSVSGRTVSCATLTAALLVV